MDSAPQELSLAEIRNFMLKNNCKVTNHALVKHFRSFLTNKETQEDARKLFKTYVNTLASIKNEGNEKFLILRKRYVQECPTEDAVNVSYPMSPGSRSLTIVASDSESSPFKQPPPYRPPPEISDLNNTYSYQGSPHESVASSRKNSADVGRSGSEYSFGSELMYSVDSRKIGSGLLRSESSDSRKFSEVSRKPSVELYQFDTQEEPAPAVPPRKRNSVDQIGPKQGVVEEKNVETVRSVSLEVVQDINKENHNVGRDLDGGSEDKNVSNVEQQEGNKLSVKEKMMKFNRFASEEEAKIPSPIGKKKPEKNPNESLSTENLVQHPKAKEWLIAAANANYQDLAKLSIDYPNLVKLQTRSTAGVRVETSLF
ncbi:uncharacterized protein LOC128736022 [Sabethes cyaneus]|uniref:uncharacterized protein LOC128736022 n=1 Tax=Sabethes cyaneus TaxID=53552 RepID=UPI00237E896E|nr:uncharacterized protein LOC128736022 [Sabethes cyaneus]